MHLIHDENGNLCPHSHEHEHPHTHTYEHTHPHSHEHGHEDEHDHAHGDGAACAGDAAACSGDCGGCQEGHAHPEEAASGDKTAALLDYMLRHNEHHAAELDQLAGKLQAEGRAGAAGQIKKAVDEFQKGNMYLSLALSMVREA